MRDRSTVRSSLTMSRRSPLTEVWVLVCCSPGTVTDVGELPPGERPYFVRAEGVAFERPDGSYVSPAHVPFASEVLAKVRTFDGLIGALEQFD